MLVDWKHRVLIVEDDEAERHALTRVLRLERFEVLGCASVSAALQHLGATPVDLVISDLRLGTASGVDLMRQWREVDPLTPFLILTAYGTVDCAVSAMKLGAEDFLLKPIDPVHLLDLVHHILGDGETDSSRRILEQVNQGFSCPRIVGRSRALVEVCRQTLRAAQSPGTTVLVTGESGTGKELIAEALHRNSERREQPFVVINMAAIPEALVESELFGHVRGAFTSAVSHRTGRFEQANRGTLFIDEIGDFPLHLQAKLLRALENRQITPVGGESAVTVDVRIVAATSRRLQAMVQAGTFREDLYYRLNVVTLDLPPLRERRADILELTQHFLKQFSNPQPSPSLSSAHGSEPGGLGTRELSSELRRTLQRLNWPGNVRQLRNCLERMCVMSDREVLTPTDLPIDVFEQSNALAQQEATQLETLTRTAIMDALNHHDGNRTHAAAALGISVRTLQRKLRQWGLTSQ